jgi:hypothetical protein
MSIIEIVAPANREEQPAERKICRSPAIPFGVVSLLEMLRFAAEDFWKAAELLATLAAHPTILSHPNGRAKSVNTLNELLKQCDKLKLAVSLKEAEKILPALNSASTSPDRIPHLVASLSSVIQSELDTRMFFYMDPLRVEYWHPLWLEDSPLRNAFPKVHKELQSAGRCYAYGEAVACVFHLMRVIDSGLRAVADSLGISYDARNWSGIGHKIQGKMEEKYTAKTDEWKQSEPVYASILTDIQAIGRGHRNPTLHEVEKKYTEAEAHYLLTVTQAFMLHLAESGMREKQ